MKTAFLTFSALLLMVNISFAFPAINPQTFTNQNYYQLNLQTYIDQTKTNFNDMIYNWYVTMQNPAFVELVNKYWITMPGNDPVFTFDFGDFGLQEIDLSEWPPAIFLTLKAIITMSAMFWAGRIIMRG